MADSGGMTDCSWYEVGCKVGGVISDGVGAIAHDLLVKAGDAITFLNKGWLSWSPGIDTESNAVAQIQANLWWYTGAIAILGILIALSRMVLSNDFKSLIGVAKPIVNLIIVTGTYAVGIRLLDDAGNELAVWLFEQIEVNYDGSVGLDAITGMIVMNPQAVNAAIGGALIVGLLALLGAVVLFAFMIFRDVMVLIMLAFLPTLAASTGTETGDQAFKKANGWLLALLLFKPVAAVVIALGVTLMGDNTSISGEAEGGIMRPVSGVIVICLASLALPALIKFVVPAASAGSGAFSGGAAVAGAATVAGGAAVLAASAGTGGGAGAAAGGGSKLASAGGEKGVGAPTGGGTSEGPAGATSSPSSDGGGGPASGGAPADAGTTAGESSSGDGGPSSGTGSSGGETGSTEGAAPGQSSTGGSPEGTSSGSSSEGDSSGETSASGAEQTGGTGGSGGPSQQPAGGSPSGGGTSGSDVAALTQALGQGSADAQSGLDEAAEGS
ncbi:hypothetical protein [Brevibacterium yomogidense]|uniref:hypothetical protein n=1 Tax=Brevibacterium yomogidense TaxID=946573 RepID=UPI0018DFE70E|nr:hypothetical protein [Brevibacterium yomogidense]